MWGFLLLDSKAFYLTCKKFAVFIPKQDFLLHGRSLQLLFFPFPNYYTEITIKEIKYVHPIYSRIFLHKHQSSSCKYFMLFYLLSKNLLIKSTSDIAQRKFYSNFKTDINWTLRVQFPGKYQLLLQSHKFHINLILAIFCHYIFIINFEKKIKMRTSQQEECPLLAKAVQKTSLWMRVIQHGNLSRWPRTPLGFYMRCLFIILYQLYGATASHFELLEPSLWMDWYWWINREQHSISQVRMLQYTLEK